RRARRRERREGAPPCGPWLHSRRSSSRDPFRPRSPPSRRSPADPPGRFVGSECRFERRPARDALVSALPYAARSLQTPGPPPASVVLDGSFGRCRFGSFRVVLGRFAENVRFEAFESPEQLG